MSGTRISGLWGKIAVLLVVCCLTVVAQGKYGGGSGTLEDPYQIRDANHMQAIGADSNDWDKCFKLMADIDLAGYTGTEFNIIGYYITRPLHEPIEVPFSGVFDGNDNVIYSFTYSSNERDNVGLFGFVDDANAEIRNLTLIAPDVNAATKSDVGSLIGVLNAGHILNCKVEGGSIYGRVNIGGLVGSVTSTSGRISNCYSSAMVSGDDNIGGLVGRNTANIIPGKGGKITNCFASGAVSGDSFVGGLVGLNCWLISDCYATGNISGISNTGGLVGDNYVGTISRSYAKGNVKGRDKTGGIVGWNTGGTISNCYAVGEVHGINDTGGLIGRNVSGMLLFNMVSNSYAVGDVSGVSNTGGLVGFGSSVVSYTSCFWDSDINPDVNGIGNRSDPNVESKTTVEMHQQSTFQDWDFINVWNIGENQTYPYLRIYLPSDINKDGIVNFLDFAITANQWMQEQ